MLKILASILSFLGLYKPRAVVVRKVLQKEKPADVRTPPEDGHVYAWALPSDGRQSLVVLGIKEGGQVDAAFLVPVRLCINGIELQPDKAKKLNDTMDDLIGGQLKTAFLFGAGHGCLRADFWLAGSKDEKGRWLSDELIKLGLVRKAK